jgi:hypothetical protein
MPSVYLEAYTFANSPTMLDVDDAKAKKFADGYAKKCNNPGRLNQKFYEDAYNVASELGFESENQRKRFVADFALSCNPRSLITEQVYSQMYEFAHSASMMSLDDLGARKFVYNFLLKCGRENYLTQHNWDKVQNYALNNLNKLPTEAEEFSRQFFVEFRPL